MYRLAVGDDYVFEWKLEKLAQCGRGPLLRQPDGCLFAAPSILEGYHPSWKLTTWLDRLQLGVGYVIGKEEPRSIRWDTIAAYDQINVPNVIRLEHNDRCRMARIEPLPHISRARGWSKRIQNQSLPLTQRLSM